MKIKTLVTVLALAATGCVSGTVTEPSACVSTDLGTIPAFPIAGIQIPPQTFSTNVDFSKVVSKIDDVGNSIQASISTLTLQGTVDMGWLRSAVITASTTDGSNLSGQLAHYTAPTNPTGDDVTFNFDMNTATILNFFSHPVELTYTLSGMTISQPISLNDTLCIAVSGKASKSL